MVFSSQSVLHEYLIVYIKLLYIVEQGYIYFTEQTEPNLLVYFKS